MDIDRPESVGLSSEHLARLDARMQHYVDENKLAGIITLIARRRAGGALRHVRHGRPGGGPADAARHDLPHLLDDEAYHLCRGPDALRGTRFRLTDPLSAYIPAFKDVQVLDNAAGSGVRLVPPARPITIVT